MAAYRLTQGVDQDQDENEIADDYFNLQSGIQKRNEIIDLLYNNAEDHDNMADEE